MIENILDSIEPDWQFDGFGAQPELRSDIEVCAAALSYLKVLHLKNTG